MSEPTAGDTFASKLGVSKVQGEAVALQQLFNALLVILKQKGVLDDHEISVLISTAETLISGAYTRTIQGMPQGAEQLNEMKVASDAVFSTLREIISETDHP